MERLLTRTHTIQRGGKSGENTLCKGPLREGRAGKGALGAPSSTSYVRSSFCPDHCKLLVGDSPQPFFLIALLYVVVCCS